MDPKNSVKIHDTSVSIIQIRLVELPNRDVALTNKD